MSAKQNNNTIYLVIIGILSLIIIFFLINTFKKGGQVLESADYQDLSIQKDSLFSEYVDMMEELGGVRSELYTMTGENESLDSLIGVRDSILEERQKVLNFYFKKQKITASELEEARSMIASLSEQSQTYVMEIDSLYRVNELLMEENQTLQYALGEEKRRADNLEIKSAYLEDKFKIGSLMPVENLVAGAILEKKGKEVVTRALKKADKVRFCFQTGENKVVESGSMEMVMRLVAPDGSVVMAGSRGSGTMREEPSGKKIEFTKKFEFEYENANKRICIYWEEPLPSTGTYQVQLYQDGHNIASTVFSVK